MQAVAFSRHFREPFQALCVCSVVVDFVEFAECAETSGDIGCSDGVSRT